LHQKTLFQHHISGTAADFLRMAGKSIIEPDWQWVVSIYPTFFIHADGI
jgi:hypothetical protein